MLEIFKTFRLFLDELSETSSKLEKQAIVEKYKDNENIKNLLLYTYDANYIYYISNKNIQKLKVSNKLDEIEIDSIDNLFKLLDTLRTRVYTWHRALAEVINFINQYSDYEDIIIKVLEKDLKVGVNEKTIENVFWKNFIRTTPYMWAISYNKKKVDEIFKKTSQVFSDLKMDGRYSNVKITSDWVFLESRNWKDTFFNWKFDSFSALKDLFWFEVVLNWEFVIPGLDRNTSNWIVNSIVKIGEKIKSEEDITKELKDFEKRYNTTLDEALDSLTLVVWDYIPLSDYFNWVFNVERHKRFQVLTSHIESFNHKQLKIVDTKIISTKEEALLHFQEVVKNWEEGTILKSYDWIWKDWKPNWQIKFKIEDYYDLKITGFNYWKTGTKNEHLINSLNVESEDGLLKTSPGWISESDMKYITENQEELLWKIVEVKCSWLSHNKDWEYSLLQPSFIKVRDDKNEAATLEQCIEIHNSNKTLG